MSWVAAGIALAGAATSAYGASQQKKAAEAAAKGGQVQPYGQTGEMMDALLNDAWQQFKWGNFQFGPDPNVYNQWLDWGGNRLGLDTSGLQRIDPNAGYGFNAYQQMLDLIQGPAWQGRTVSQPVAPTQNPWVAGLMGGLGGYAAGGGFGGGGGVSNAPTGMQIAAVDPGFSPWYENYAAPDGFQLGMQTIQGAVPTAGGGS